MTPEARPLVLDAGALIALERRGRLAGALLQGVRDLRVPVLIPAGVLAQVWRDGARQARLSALLGDRDVSVVALDAAQAKAAGELCGQRRTSDPIDASVVLLARQVGAV